MSVTVRNLYAWDMNGQDVNWLAKNAILQIDGPDAANNFDLRVHLDTASERTSEWL